MPQLRCIVCSMVGHVDHGKTSILDRIRDTNVVAGEAGLITQCISCTNIPFEVIKKLCKDFPQINNLKIPGLLMIDTPGHASFTNLRKRGGSLADIAVLVIDLNEGIKPQTLESIEILRHNKTPFVIAANKLDLIPGFRKTSDSLLNNLNSQPENTSRKVDEKLYDIVGRLVEYKINADRFDRVEDYSKKIAIIPLSAKLGLGIPELLLLLTGLAQKFMEKQLNVDVTIPAKGVVLEVKEEKGLGKALEVIIYDGKIEKGDELVIAGLEFPTEVKVRNLFETSFKTKKLVLVDKVEAAATLKIVTTESDEIFAGMPFEVVTQKTIAKIKSQIQEEVEEVLMETDGKGVIIKADSLGSLEALISLLKENNIEIKKASLGNINKSDISEASAEENPIFKTILAFNVKSNLTSQDVKIISHEVIYKIIDDYKEWKEKETKKSELEKLKGLFRPGKFIVLPGTIFRQNNPAIFGVDILQGSISTDCPIMRDDGFHLGVVKAIQVEGENMGKVERGKQAAISVPGITIGRHLFENSIVYTDINEDNFRRLKEMKTFLNQDEVKLLKDIAVIKRRNNPLWGV